jgi:hypothetical protein
MCAKPLQFTATLMKSSSDRPDDPHTSPFVQIRPNTPI